MSTIEVTTPGAIAVEVTEGDVVELDVTPVEVALEVAVAGAPGPPGPSASFRHVQSTPAASWLITHNLGKQVLPTLVLDEEPGIPVTTDVEFVDDNSCIVIWSRPVSGRAEW